MRGMRKVVVTSVKNCFDELVTGLNQDNIDFVFDAGQILQTADGLYTLMMWSGELNFDFMGKFLRPKRYKSSYLNQ